jgi:P-type Ca2+ transporter type 2C
MNRMTVVEAVWAGKHVVYQAAGEGGGGSAPGISPADRSAAVVAAAAAVEKGTMSNDFRRLVAAGIAANSQASLQHMPNGIVEHLGSKTECALLQLVEDWGMSWDALRVESPPSRIYLFDSTKKRMSSAIDTPGSATSTRLFTKGAPEVVVNICTKALDGDGITITELDKYSRAAIIEQVDDMAGRGLRTLLLCYRDVEHAKDDEVFWKEAPERDLIFLGVVGIKDPIRPETREAVRLLKGAGVSVRMVTGDNKLTASFIAKEAGILDEGGLVMTGPEFRALSPTEMDACALKIQVLARATPNDKLILVREHKKLGEVVAVTGDGTNDAPALKEADVGFALGVAGTEIAKEACDIVILDDNIQSMAKAVLWGRNVYESIRKFIQFQLVVNVVAVSLNVIAAFAGVPLPLNPVPLLWVNMIMDSMGALALATESPRPELMDRKPYGRRAPLINRAMYRNICGVAVYQLLVSLVLQYAGKSIFGLDKCQQLPNGRKVTDRLCPGDDLEINSIIFNTFVFMQIASEVNSRRIPEMNVFAGITRSYMFCLIVAITVVIQVVLMLVVGGSNVGVSIGIGKISGAAWGMSVVIGLLLLPWGALVRLYPLDWAFGPTDEDPLAMSKLETLLHLPKRKPPIFDVKTDQELGIVDASTPSLARLSADTSGPAEAAATGATGGVHLKTLASDELAAAQPAAVSPAKVRLRVFVHAVAFVNVVSRSAAETHDLLAQVDRDPDIK